MDLDFRGFELDRNLVIFRVDRSVVDMLFQMDGYNDRCAKFIEYIVEQQGDWSAEYIADFDDRIPAVYEPFQSAGFAVFAKNRPVGSTAPIILWTHETYRSARERGIAGKIGNVPWEAKIPELIWRGRPRGTLPLSDGRFMVAQRVYQAMRAAEPIPGDYHQSDFRQLADEHLIRFRLVSRYADSFDVRFVDFGDHQLNAQPEIREFSEFAKANYRFDIELDIEELSRRKYLLVLGGNDAGTQINWALSSNSVILMPPIRFHSTTTLGLSEWVHYVPVRYDLDDLPEKVDWCRRNDEACRVIAESAKAYVANFSRSVEDEINHQVIARYNSPRGVKSSD